MSGVLVKAGTVIPRGPRYLVCHAPAAVTIGCDGFQMTSTREKYPTHFSLHERLYPVSRSIHTQWAMGAMVQEVSLLSHGGMSSTIQYMSQNQDQKVISSNMFPAMSQPWFPSVYHGRRQRVNVYWIAWIHIELWKMGHIGQGWEQRIFGGLPACHVMCTQFHFPAAFLPSSFSPFLHLPDSQWIDETPDWVNYTHQDLNPSQNPCSPQEDNSPIISSPEIHSCLSH